MAQCVVFVWTSLVVTSLRTNSSVGGSFRVSVGHSMRDVEAVWRSLTATQVESPGQMFDFVRLWIDALGIPQADQFFILAEDDGAPVALIPLQRRWDKGVRVLSWFPGSHVGCNAPIVD